MNTLLPSNYLEFIGGLFLVLSIVFLFLSLRKSISERCAQYFSMLSIIGIALIANHAGVYLAVVFIIATAATELEFLQNLAAIVRGNKDYFDYKKNSGGVVPSEKASIKLTSKIPYKSNHSEL